MPEPDAGIGRVGQDLKPRLAVSFVEAGGGQSESRQRDAAIFFQKTILRPWKEVDDAVTANREAQRRRADIARAVTENQAALRAARS
jgi:ABC-type nitrate/sulfonate/bicarbonate transport system ATPase subunit